MRNHLILACAAILSLQSSALEVSTTAGALHTDVTDLTASTLTVSGSLDARDFRFMVDSMPALTTLDLSNAVIEAYDDSDGALLSSVTTYPADVLPQCALMGSAVSQVTLPTTLTGIGQAALAGCAQLTTISFPTTLTSIGAYAFSGSALTAVEVPATVTLVGEGAFAGCEQLQQAVLHSAVIGNEAFKRTTMLSDVTLGSEVTTIGDGAFAGCTLLEGVTLSEPCAVASIGREAFSLSGLKQIDLGGMPQLTTLGAWAFANTPIQTLDVPSTVTTLGEGALYYATQLTQASIPSLVRIPDYAFAGNHAADFSELLGEGTEQIGAYAFYGDSTSIIFTLPSTITYIGTKAMAGMTGLQRLDVLGDVARLGDSVWACVNQPLVNLDTHRDNEVSDLFAEADQWREFHILHDYLLGDVNSDTRINVRDITTTVDYIMEREPSVFVFPAADVLADKVINVRDITGLADLILDERYDIVRAVHGSGRMPNSIPYTDDELQMPDLVIAPGASSTIAVNLSSTRTYNALQFDLVLPEGMTLSDCRLDGRLSNHVHTVGEREEGGYRIVAYSVDNAPIAAGEGHIIELDVQAAQQTYGNVIVMENIIFADLESDYAASPSLSAIDNVTGVDDLAAVHSKAWGEQGQIVIESNATGMAQVVAVNGTVREVNIERGRTMVDATPGVYVVVIAGHSHKVVVK